MNLSQVEMLTHTEARQFVRRSIDKTEALKNCGVFVAVDESGAPVTSSRMDGVAGFAVRLSRAKAYCAAALREPSAVIYDRLKDRPAGIFLGYQDFARDHFFIGQGAMLIEQKGVTVGALATGAGIGPFAKIDGVEAEQLIVDGKPANLEDLIICYALGIPYQSQHGDDDERWLKAYDKPASEFGEGRGFEESPEAQNQVRLDEAIKLADAAMAEAERRKVAVSVVVTDRTGDQIQLDRMNGAAPMTPDLAEAMAVTAINFQSTSRAAAEFIKANPGYESANEIAPYNFLAVAGGVPIYDGATLVGGLGVAGAEPRQCEDIAITAVSACGGSIEGN